MHICIFSQCVADIALIARSLPEHDCHGMHRHADVRQAQPHLLIVDIASAGMHLTELMQLAKARAMPVLLLAAQASNELAVLTAWRESDGAYRSDSEFKPLRRHAIAARVRLLLQHAYPEQDKRQQQFGAYLFESSTQSVTHAGIRTPLTHKEFTLALLLFSHLGRALSRAYLQECIWGQEAANAASTRTIDTHVARVRNKLVLKPENGFRLGTVYGYGYQLEQLNEPAQETAKSL